ncbi:MAG: YlxR family protein [Anaerolineales bacterium]|nr:YlxR family protein [Anaerolineales bacterium]
MSKAKSAAPRVKHVPQRTCVACRAVQAKRTLVRLVRTPEGVFVDEQGKRPGRGAYLHLEAECWQRGLRGALDKALRTALTAEDRERLEGYYRSVVEKN